MLYKFDTNLSEDQSAYFLIENALESLISLEYEKLKKDYETHLPKLMENAVVFHLDKGKKFPDVKDKNNTLVFLYREECLILFDRLEEQHQNVLAINDNILKNRIDIKLKLWTSKIQNIYDSISLNFIR